MASPALISGQVTSYNSPQYEGLLYGITPTDTPLLSMLGGLYGGEGVNSTVFNWQEFDLRAAAQTGTTEGATAPSATGRARGNVFNVLQIIHETVSVSYTKQAATQQRADVGTDISSVVATGLDVAVTDELAWQVMRRMEEIARDCEYTIINGSFQDATNVSDTRKTRGLLAAASTNSTDVAGTAQSSITGSSSDDVIAATAHGLSDGDKIQFTAITNGTGISTNTTYYVVNSATNTFQISTQAGGTVVTFADFTAGTFEPVTDLTQAIVLNLLQDVYSNGGIMQGETSAIVANGWNKRALTQQFVGVTAGGYRQSSRNVGGVAVDTIITDFGELNVVLDRHMPANTIMVVSLEECRLKWLNHPKGHLFAEPLGLTGSFEPVQIYGEWGLQYGNELAHGQVSGLSTR